MAPLPHPTWPARRLLIIGVIGIGCYCATFVFLVFAAVHYILKFW
jgi:hypothetical protein